MPVDYHMHTHLSDGKHSHREMLRSAIGKGLKEIGFSDHLCLKPVGWAMTQEDIPIMLESIRAAKEEALGRLEVRFGIEVDYFPDREKEISMLIASLNPDYVIGSVHFIGDWNFDSDTAPYDSTDINRAYQQYFRMVQRSARSGLFDIIGHCDLIKKFGYFPTVPMEELYEETARAFKESGVVVELNTSGQIKPCQEFYPSPSILSHLAMHRVPVTLGSDAHVEQNVAQFFPKAILELKALGYKELNTFNGRVRGEVRI